MTSSSSRLVNNHCDAHGDIPFREARKTVASVNLLEVHAQEIVIRQACLPV